MLQIRWRGIEDLDQPMRERVFERDPLEILRRGDTRFDLLQSFRCDGSGIIGADFEAVPGGRVMARGDIDRARGLLVEDGVRNHWRRHWLVDQENMDAMCSKHFRCRWE